MTDNSITPRERLDDYYNLLRRKRRMAIPRGLNTIPSLNPAMFG